MATTKNVRNGEVNVDNSDVLNAHPRPGWPALTLP